MILGIIPARGGSKRISRKNIKVVGGKPMLAWTIEAAKRSRLLDRFVVSTEDAEIADIAENWGAEVFDRKPELAADDASIYDVVFDVLREIPADWVVLLHPTSPLRTAADIDACINRCLINAAPSCVSCEHMVPVPNGAVYVAYVRWLKEHKNFDGPRTVIYQMPSYRSIDVDTQVDFDRAEVLFRKRKDDNGMQEERT